VGVGVGVAALAERFENPGPNANKSDAIANVPSAIATMILFLSDADLPLNNFIKSIAQAPVPGAQN